MFKITNNIIYNNKIKKDIKLSIIGDIHITDNTDIDLLNNIIISIKEQNPNYICLIGDIIDTPLELYNKNSLSILKDFLYNLSSITKTIIVLGSHDIIFKKKYIPNSIDIWKSITNHKNIYLLDNNIYKDKNILFMGYTLKEQYYYNFNNNKKEDLNIFYKDLKKHKNLYTNLDNDIVKVSLIHSPEFMHNKRNIKLLKDYDLIICAHNHNGLIPKVIDDIYKGNRGIINSKKEIFPKYTRGLINNKVLITGGITKVSEVSMKMFKFINYICNRHIDTVTFTNKK